MSVVFSEMVFDTYKNAYKFNTANEIQVLLKKAVEETE